MPQKTICKLDSLGLSEQVEQGKGGAVLENPFRLSFVPIRHERKRRIKGEESGRLF